MTKHDRSPNLTTDPAEESGFVWRGSPGPGWNLRRRAVIPALAGGIGTGEQPLQPHRNCVFTYFDHTGDIGVDLAADGPDQLFVDAARALFESITDPALARAEPQPPVTLQSEALDLLLHDWLSELLYRFETAGFVPSQVHPAVRQEAEGWRLVAELQGESQAAARLPIKVLVKAITYHQLAAVPTPDGWRGRVIFDI